MSEISKDLTRAQAKDIPDINVLIKKSLINTHLNHEEIEVILERLQSQKGAVTLETKTLLQYYLATFKPHISPVLHGELKKQIGDHSPTYLPQQEVQQENKRLLRTSIQFDENKLPVKITKQYPLKDAKELMDYIGTATERGIDNKGNQWIFQGEYNKEQGWTKGTYYSAKDGTQSRGEWKEYKLYNGKVLDKRGDTIEVWKNGEKIEAEIKPKKKLKRKVNSVPEIKSATLQEPILETSGVAQLITQEEIEIIGRNTPSAPYNGEENQVNNNQQKEENLVKMEVIPTFTDTSKGVMIDSKEMYEKFISQIGVLDGIAWEKLPDEIKYSPKGEVLTMSFENKKINVYYSTVRQNDMGEKYVMKYGEIKNGRFEKSGFFGSNFSWDSLDNNNSKIIHPET